MSLGWGGSLRVVMVMYVRLSDEQSRKRFHEASLAHVKPSCALSTVTIGDETFNYYKSLSSHSGVPPRYHVRSDFSSNNLLVFTFLTRLGSWSSSGLHSHTHTHTHTHTEAYLYFNGPGEVADVDVEGDVGVAPEGELLTGEAVSVLLDIGLGDDGDLLSRHCPSYRGTQQEHSSYQ